MDRARIDLQHAVGLADSMESVPGDLLVSIRLDTARALLRLARAVAAVEPILYRHAPSDVYRAIYPSALEPLATLRADAADTTAEGG